MTPHLHPSVDAAIADLPSARASLFEVTHTRPGKLICVYSTLDPARAWATFRRFAWLGGEVVLSRRGSVIRRSVAPINVS